MHREDTCDRRGRSTSPTWPERTPLAESERRSAADILCISDPSHRDPGLSAQPGCTCYLLSEAEVTIHRGRLRVRPTSSTKRRHPAHYHPTLAACHHCSG